MSSAAAFSYSPLLPIGEDQTDYRLISDEGVDVVNGPGDAGSSRLTRRC